MRLREGKDHVACDKRHVFVGCRVDGRVDAAQGTTLLVLIGNEANLSKFDQIIEKIKILGLVGGDDELVCQRKQTVDATPDERFAQEGHGRLAATHAPGFAACLQDDGQVTALAHFSSAMYLYEEYWPWATLWTTSARSQEVCEKRQGARAR